MIGSMLILVAGGQIGHIKSSELRKHLDDMEYLKQIFCMLRTEFRYTRAPFEEVFEKIGHKLDGVFQNWFLEMAKELRRKEEKGFQDIWEKKVEEVLGKSYLSRKDLEMLKEVGKNLGYFENIDLFIEQLEYEINGKREEYRVKRKLYKSLGITGGIFLVLLFL